jgi:hypothetical protein
VVNVQSSFYWSASAIAATPANAWSVLFNDGFVGTNNKANSNFVWGVRGGMNADQY